jgi:threonylcarbamoyladenosine tRNA methylthiotransferase MtaB
VARFRVDFLGCKVSHADVQAVREALLADGHRERDGDDADIAVISGCCVTNEALAKSRKAAARAARTHARVYLTGCAANLSPTSLRGLPDTVTVVAKRSE